MPGAVDRDVALRVAQDPEDRLRRRPGWSAALRSARSSWPYDASRPARAARVLQRDVAVLAASARGGRRSPGRAPAGLRGSIISSTTPSSTARSRPPAIRSCSAASSSSQRVRAARAATAASLLRCRMRTAATAPITATSAPGQAKTLVAPSDAGVHRDVRAAVGLAGHQRDPRHDGLGEGVQQLRAAAHHAVPLLADARAGSRARRRARRAARRTRRTSGRTGPPSRLRSRPGSRRAAAGCSRSRRRCGRRAGRASVTMFGAHRGAARSPGSSSSRVDERMHVVGAPRRTPAAGRRGRRSSTRRGADRRRPCCRRAAARAARGAQRVGVRRRPRRARRPSACRAAQGRRAAPCRRPRR